VIVSEGLVDQPTQPAALGIAFNLAVPDLGVIAFKPRTQLPKLRCIQFCDSLFELLYAAHGGFFFILDYRHRRPVVRVQARAETLPSR